MLIRGFQQKFSKLQFHLKIVRNKKTYFSESKEEEGGSSHPESKSSKSIAGTQSDIKEVSVIY